MALGWLSNLDFAASATGTEHPQPVADFGGTFLVIGVGLLTMILGM